MKWTLTPRMVLSAVPCAVRPRSTYINDELCRDHARAIAAEATGHPPRSSQVLRVLRQLEREGCLLQSPFADGMYGYSWTMTAKGWERLMESDAI